MNQEQRQPKQTLWVYNNQDKETYEVYYFTLKEPFNFQIERAIIDELINNLGLELTEEEYRLLRMFTKLNKVKTPEKTYFSVETDFVDGDEEFAGLFNDYWNENGEEECTLNQFQGTTNMGFEEDKVFFLQ